METSKEARAGIDATTVRPPISRGWLGRALRVASRRGFWTHWLLLFGFWIVMSGKFDALHLVSGALSASVVAGLCYSMECVKTAPGGGSTFHLAAIPWHRTVGYWIWLLREIAVANWQVLRIVVDPKLPIDPALIRFRSTLVSDLQRTILANSITLTPGTITIQVARDEFLVHALVGGEPAVQGITRMEREISRTFPELERRAAIS